MKSVENTLHIMELIAEHQPISLAKLCELIPQPKSTIQRGVNTLREFGWIKPISVVGNPEFEVTYRFLSLATTNQLVSQLSHIAKPYLINIRDFCNETTFLSTYDVNQMTVIDFIDSTHAVRLVGGSGGNLPAHLTSTGKSCLAALSKEALEKVLSTLNKKGYEINRNKLSRELFQIRKQGYCLLKGEFSEELTHIGCAIIDNNNHPVGGIGVSIPNHRYKNVQTKELAGLIVKACNEIQSELFV